MVKHDARDSGADNQTQPSRQKLATDIKQHEDFIGNAENPHGERKEVENVLPRLKEKLQSMENESSKDKREKSKPRNNYGRSEPN
jgi:hypothetical protein